MKNGSDRIELDYRCFGRENGGESNFKHYSTREGPLKKENTTLQNEWIPNKAEAIAVKQDGRLATENKFLT